jgi:hypothetical protein
MHTEQNDVLRQDTKYNHRATLFRPLLGEEHMSVAYHLYASVGYSFKSATKCMGLVTLG